METTSKKKELKISDYNFVSFDRANKDEKFVPNVVSNYEFPSITQTKQTDLKRQEEIINYIAKNSREKGFNILPIVLEHKGFKDRDYQEKERRINEEVERRFKLVEKQGFEQGYSEGVEAGKKEVYDQTRAATEEKLALLTNMINEVLGTQEELINAQKKQIYYLIRNLTKWIILKELKEDGQYLERLIEKLLIEMNAKKNLFFQVNKKDFEKMSDILEVIQQKMGGLENVRVEVDYDISKNGIVMECDNGIINGTLEQQFENLDSLFDSVGVDDRFFGGDSKDNNESEIENHGGDFKG